MLQRYGRHISPKFKVSEMLAMVESYSCSHQRFLYPLVMVCERMAGLTTNGILEVITVGSTFNILSIYKTEI